MIPNSITIDDTEYVRVESHNLCAEAPLNNDIRIVTLQRGWMVVGRYAEDGDRVVVTDASVVERWGTTDGIGQLARSGPLSDSRLRKVGTVRTHILAVLHTIDCDPSKWTSL